MEGKTTERMRAVALIILISLFFCSISYAEPDMNAHKTPSETEFLYIHLQFDGGIVIMHEDGEMMDVSLAHLHDELAAHRNAGGSLLYSREDPQKEPPKHLVNVFDAIIEYKLPIKLLEEAHPALLEKDEDYYTPLMGTAFRKIDGWLNELISRGVDLETKDAYGYTALMFAANAGNHEGLKALIKAGANINARDNQNNTPLLFAAQHGYLNSVSELITAGANVSSKGDHGMTAIDIAKQNGHETVIKLLKAAQKNRK